MTKSQQSTRVNFQMDNTSHDRLRRLKIQCSASSYTEVTCNAYRLYEHLLGLEKSGKKLIVRADTGEEETLALFIPCAEATKRGQ